jgi:hypothetical protein
MTKGNQAVLQIPESEFIDVIDVAWLVWKARTWLLSGIILGTFGAMYVAQVKKPPVFVSLLSANLDVAGGINFDSSAAKFNEFISRADVLSIFSASGGSGAGALINGKILAKLVSQPSSVMLEVSSLSADSSGEAALKLAQKLTSTARDLNKRLTEARASVSAGGAVSGRSDLEKNFAKLTSAQAREEAPLRAKLFALESKLSMRAGIRPTPSALVQGTAIGDDVLRMMGALDSKLTPEERTQVISEYSELVGAIRGVQAKYEQPVRELTGSLSVLSASVINNVTGGAGLYPVIVVDEAAYRARVAAGTHERYESKRALILVLGAILGGMMGLMGYGLNSFIGANRERIRQVFKN